MALRVEKRIQSTIYGTAAVFGTIFLVSVTTQGLCAQSAAVGSAPSPTFEVASIRRSRPGENSSWHITPNRLVITNMLMEYIIEFAYARDLGDFGVAKLADDELVGGPSWIRPGEFDYEGYDIVAKVDDAAAERFGKDCGRAFEYGHCGYRAEYLSMLQSLFADRFKLNVRQETKDGPVYALIVAKGGPKITPSPPPDAAAQNLTVPPPRPACPPGMYCFEAYTSMDRLAERLYRGARVGRPVINQTGLTGGYYIKLRWSREQNQDRPVAALPNDNAKLQVPPPLGPIGPSIFTALQQQLGLKLQPTKGPVEVLVIEHIERPSEN